MKLAKWFLIFWASFLSFFSFGKSIDNSAYLPPSEKIDLVSRINNARLILKEKAENGDLDDFTSSFLYGEDANKWGDWLNWGKWNNWDNWAKWSKWDNWLDWGNRWGNF